MAKLYDNRLGAGVLVADERVDELIASGDYSFLKGPEVHILDEAGDLYSVDPEYAKSALEAGYTYAPENIVQEGLLRKEIEETPEQTFAYGLARGMTFGMSDLFRPGASKQELRLRREMQPWVTAGGEITSLITPGGLTGLAARGAFKGSAKIIQGIASATEKANKLKRTGSVLNSRVVRGAIGGAAEGSVVGSMYGTSSSLLDDPENYPTFTDHIYAGAKFGAVAGGIIGTIATVLKGAGGTFKRMRDDAYFRSLDPKQKELRKVAGKDMANVDAVSQLGSIMRNLDRKDPATGQRILKNLDDPEALIKEIGEKPGEGLIGHFMRKLDDLKTRVEQAIKRSGQDVEDLLFDVDVVVERLVREVVLPMRKGLGGPLGLKEFQKQADDAVKAIKAFRRLALKKSGGKTKLTFRQAEEMKSEFQARAYDKATPEANAKFMRQISGILRVESEEALEAVTGKLSLIDDALLPHTIVEQFKATKDIYGALFQIQMMARGALSRKTINARFPLTAWITGAGLAGAPVGMMAGDVVTGGLASLAAFATGGLIRKYAKDSGELLLARTLGGISDYGEMLNAANVSQLAIRKSAELLVGGTSAAGVKIENPFPDSPKATVERYKELKKDIEMLRTNPQTLYVRLDKMLPDVKGNQALNQDLAQTMANVVGFLGDKIPQNVLTGQQLLQDDSQLPPMNQILKFLRYVDIANDPNKVLQYVAAGKLMPEHLEALETLFPRLYQTQMEAILNAIIDKKKVNFTMGQKASLSRFLKVPAERFFSPGFNQRTQNAYSELRKGGGEGGGGEIEPPELATDTQKAIAL